MKFLSGLYFALLGWQIYTPIHASPLSPALTAAAINFDLVPGALPTVGPTANGVALVAGALSTSTPSLISNTTNATFAGDFPPTDPYVIRLQNSPISVQFWSRHYLNKNRVQQVIQMAQVDINHHNQATPMYKVMPTKYSAGKTSLTAPTRYQGNLLWGQWGHGLDAVRVYMERFDWLGCEFDMFDHTVNGWYYDGRLMSDYALNVTTAQDETVSAAK